ncbi:fluoride efflux transporter CrcB [Allobranchiibius huperziae]|uniref:Fluoride-specific ion channel FluC n=1 Tax=Allobranchiibius huperziae TaxID=1874116 RepID=A0A853DLH7_9MICO|nr:CrcB protein [Allobranchiibius huperziae]
MSVGTYLLLCVGGGVGAVLRFVVDGLIKARVRTHIPVGTILVNLTGCLALGVLAGLAQRGALGSDALAVLGTGVLGGYTTFSTASFETARLLQDGRRGPALWSGLGTLLGGVALASLGLWLGLR